MKVLVKLQLIKEIGILKIHVFETNSFLNILIKDNGIGIDIKKLNEIRMSVNEKNKLPGKNIGIMNVYKRLSLYYGNNMHFEIESTSGKGTIVTFKFNLHKKIDLKKHIK